MTLYSTSSYKSTFIVLVYLIVSVNGKLVFLIGTKTRNGDVIQVQPLEGVEH